MKLKNIKDQMDKREIAPSAGSWDALASRLETEEKKNKKPLIYWLGAIAAVLIAAVLVYPSLNDDTDVANSSENQVVQAEDELQQEFNNATLQSNVDIPISQEPPLVENNTLEMEKKEAVESKNIILKNEGVTQVSQKVIVRIQRNENEPLPETIFKTNNGNLMTAIDSLTPVETPLTTEEEMELLLRQAMNKVEMTEVAVKSINPDQLLRETEWDIESDKRNKLQNSLQNGLNFLKAEAIAIVEGRN